MDREVERIITKEDGEVLRCILMELCQMNKQNQDRVLLLYAKR